MIHRVIETAGAAVLLAAGIGAVSASAAPVNRPLADELTQQLNQRELRQMQASDVTIYAPGDTGRVYSVPRDQPGTPPQPAGLYPPPSPPPGWRNLPR